MADLTINSVAVVTPSGVSPRFGIVTANVNAGWTVYQVNSTHVALANATTNSNTATVAGITVDQAFTGQTVGYVGSGTMVIGATIPVGHVLVQSPNAGLICNHADLTTNHWLTVIGYGNNSTTVQIAITATGLQRA